MIELTQTKFMLCMFVAFYLGGFVRAFSHTIHMVTTKMPIEKTVAVGQPLAYWAGVLYAALMIGIFWPLNKVK